MYCVNGKYFADLYRNKLSGYAEWCESELGCGFYFNAASIGPYMSLDAHPLWQRWMVSMILSCSAVSTPMLSRASLVPQSGQMGPLPSLAVAGGAV